MATYPIGAHTYIFCEYGFDHDRQFDEIYDTVAAAGYETIEIHGPNLDVPNWLERTQAALQRTGLRLIGASHGGPLWDIAREREILETMDAYGDKIAALGDGLLCGYTCGGKHLADRTREENEQMVKMWIKVAELLRAKGVTLNYHTHGEPLEDIDLVLDRVPADLLPLGPDLDWLRYGGTDPEDFVRANSGRIITMHARDYHLGGPAEGCGLAEGRGDRTEALGEGDADYGRLARLLDEVGYSGEFLVELALPPGKPATRSVGENLRLSREHIRATMGA
jgi:sugar phosphate isomerase/epimerase